MHPGSKPEARAAGARFYFTGKACKRAHIALRYTNDGHCTQCAAEHQKKWWGARPSGEKQRRWKEWLSQNRDRRNAYKRASGWKSDPDKKRKYAQGHPEQSKAAGRRYYLKNKAKYRQKVRNRYARQVGAEGSHTPSDVHAILAQQAAKCAYCRVRIGEGYHVDHIMPLALGGSNDKQNIQLLCAGCNLSKGAKHPIEFAQRRGMLL